MPLKTAQLRNRLILYMKEKKIQMTIMTSPLQLHQENYFFFKELFLDSDLIRSCRLELREFEEVATEKLFARDWTLSHESSVTIVMASCSWALAIERVTTCNKSLGSFQQEDSYRELGRL